MKDFDVKNEGKPYKGDAKDHANYYGEFCVGWTYRF